MVTVWFWSMLYCTDGFGRKACNVQRCHLSVSGTPHEEKPVIDSIALFPLKHNGSGCAIAMQYVIMLSSQNARKNSMFSLPPHNRK